MRTLTQHEFLVRIERDTSGIFVASDAGAWRIEVIVDNELRWLAADASAIGRTFASLDAASEYLHAVGISEFTLIGSSSANDTADYDIWARHAIREGLLEADDPATEWVSHETMEAMIDRQMENAVPAGSGRQPNKKAPSSNGASSITEHCPAMVNNSA